MTRSSHTFKDLCSWSESICWSFKERGVNFPQKYKLGKFMMVFTSIQHIITWMSPACFWYYKFWHALCLSCCARLFRCPREGSKCSLQSWLGQGPTLWLWYRDSSRTITKSTLLSNYVTLLCSLVCYCAELFALMHCHIIHNRYSPNELRYLPLNTALFEPPLDPELPALDSEPDSDDPEDGKDEKKNKNSSVRY